jgi:hypothetical protein
MTVFEVHEVFMLDNGKTVFAGNYSSGAKTLGAYRVSVGGRYIGLINIREEMHFPSKGTTDLALCTFDEISRAELDVNKKIVLTLSE